MTPRTTGPPALEGYTPLALVGHGGHADVFTYQQRSPRRTVAIKVLAAPDDPQEAAELSAALEAEANYLADLSQHPSIVTVHDAGVAPDGRPFIVMEYCSRPGLGAIYRRQRLGVPDVLRIGVRLASAVETAHRAGVLHRDIKPANVLVTDFGWPALADFGIAGAVGGDTAAGVSVPWAAPEVLRQGRADERSDIYSLGATLYALLAQRSPYELPGADNDPYDLMARIERGNPPRIGRPDVPASLEAALARALGPAPARYRSAADLGRALQQVEAELSLPVTELDLPEVAASAPSWVDATGTAPAPPGASQPGAAGAGRGTPLQPWEATRVRPVAEVGGGTGERPGRAAGGQAAARAGDGERSRRFGWLGVLVTVAVVAVAVLAVVLATRSGGGSPVVTPAPTSTLALGASAPEPTNLTATRVAGGVEVAWVNPVPRDGDQYAWARDGSTLKQLVATTEVLVPAADDERVCVDVWVVRADGSSSRTPGSVCVD